MTICLCSCEVTKIFQNVWSSQPVLRQRGIDDDQVSIITYNTEEQRDETEVT